MMTPQTNAKVFQKLVLPTMVSNRINQNRYNSLNKQSFPQWSFVVLQLKMLQPKDHLFPHVLPHLRCG